MSLPTNPNLLMAGGTSPYYNVQRSLRFRASASAYLNRTFGTPTNNKIWTYSLWVKRGNLGTEQDLLNANSVNAQLYFDSTTNTLRLYDATSGAVYYTSQVFRDVSAWYHIIISMDTTQSTAGNRTKFYVNGVQVTAFSTATNATLNNGSAFNVASTIHVIGRYNPSAINYFDGYLAEVNFVDGQQLDASYFGYTDPTTGVWMPKKYSGTYGTNGFYLPFTNTTNTTNLCLDASGNGNNWTPTNISTTTGVTYDSMLDVPTNWGDGGNGRGNYAVLNPLIPSTNTFSQGNLVVTAGAVPNAKFVSTIGVTSGKWYMEFAFSAVNNATIGITSTTVPQAYLGSADGNTSVSFWPSTTQTSLYVNGVSQTFSGSATTWANTDIAGLALDANSGTIALYKNGTLVGSAYSYTSLWTGLTYFAGGNYISGQIYYANFGQRPFAYTPPSGFKTLNTLNLPTPTILNGAKYMAATLYTGTGSAQTISNQVNSGNNPSQTPMQPDLIWIKARNVANSHCLTDSVRGVNYQLSSNLTAGDINNTQSITAINSNGFTVGTSTYYDVNILNSTEVAWQWNAGSGVTSSNTAGSITSAVSVNQTAGFSVVTYTGTGSNATVGHGLNVAPSMMIIKWRTGGSTESWAVYHSSIGNTNYLSLNTTNASASGVSLWNNTSPTSSVFTVGTDTWVNASTRTYVGYLWAAIKGFSAFGSYTGNGSTDGPFIYCGFRPRWILLKISSTTGDWVIYDSTRNAYNVADLYLYPDSAAAEAGSGTPRVDFLSNGFKLRNSGQDNISSATYIYAAFAENPFNVSRAR